MKLQKKSLSIIIAVIGITALTAAAAGVWSANQPVQQQPDAQLTAQRSVAVGELDDPVYAYLANTYTGEELYQKTSAYALVKVSQQPTTEESQYLAQLLQEGKPIEAVLDAYQFWSTTNAPLSVAGQIAAGYQPAFAEISYWTEQVYDAVSGNQNALSTEDVTVYLQQGISREEILMANELSRKNVYTIQQILQQRGQGKPWFDIISGVYEGLSAPLAVPDGKKAAYRGIEDGSLITRSIFLSARSGKTLEYWLDLAAQDDAALREASSDYVTALYADELEWLQTRGLFAPTGEAAAELAQHEAYLDGQLRAVQVSAEQTQALQAQGYAKEEIFNAAVEAKAKGHSVQQQLQQR